MVRHLTKTTGTSTCFLCQLQHNTGAQVYLAVKEYLRIDRRPLYQCHFIACIHLYDAQEIEQCWKRSGLKGGTAIYMIYTTMSSLSEEIKSVLGPFSAHEWLAQLGQAA